MGKKNKTVGCYDVRLEKGGDKLGSVPVYDNVVAKDKSVEEEIKKQEELLEEEKKKKESKNVDTDDWEVIEIKSDDELKVDEDAEEEEEEMDEEDDDVEFSEKEEEEEDDADAPFYGEPE